MLEMEEQRQSREFQLQMMALLCNQGGQAQDSNSSGQPPGPSFNHYHPMYSFADNAVNFLRLLLARVDVLLYTMFINDMKILTHTHARTHTHSTTRIDAYSCTHVILFLNHAHTFA